MPILKILTIITAFIISGKSQPCEITTPTLCVNSSNAPGFGDLTNQYAFAMGTFEQSVYVGTLNTANPPLGVLAFFGGVQFETNGAQVYKGDLNGQLSFTQVINNGLDNSLNFGVRQIATVGSMYLYAVTGNYFTGFELWRTQDGITWTVIMQGGFGDVENISGRGLREYDGYLYIGVENRNSGAKIFRRAVTETGDFVFNSTFEEVVSDGLGDTNNWWFSDFEILNGYLYVGTLNIFGGGMQLYRSNDGTTYQQLFAGGNGDFLNWGAMELEVYNNKLYIGTWNVLGAQLFVNNDAAATVFVPVFTGGNGDSSNFYVWTLEAYQNRLYLGTFNIGGSGFDLYSSTNPEEDGFVTETLDGFGEPGYYGIRSMAVLGDKLIIGSATAEAELGCKVYEATFLGNNRKIRYNETRKVDQAGDRKHYQQFKKLLCNDEKYMKIAGIEKFCAN